MKKRVVVTVSIIIALFFINFVFAESISEDLHLNIQTTNSTGGVVTGTFNFVFNISKFSNCASPIYTNSTTLTTDSRGIISYYLPNVSLDYSEQYYLCYYRDGILKDSVKIARSPYSFAAKNVTLSGVIPDSNFNIGSYNMSAQYYFGNGTYLVDVNDTLSQLSCLNEQVVKWNATTSLWYCSDISSPGAGDIDAVNTDGIYLSGGQTSGTVNLAFNETKLNQTIDNRISSNNASIVNWANSIFAQISNIVNLVGNWSAERVNYYNTTQIVEINTSMKYYVDFQNTSQNNYIALQNGSIVNYINLTNNSMKNYIDSNFLSNSNQSSMNVNNSQYLDGYDSSFFMPLNTSVSGNFDFNGGWTNNGISIIDGSLYAQAGYFYNISSLQVSNLNVNGSLFPANISSGQFDIGSVFSKWRDLYLSGTINAANANITGTLYVAGVNISQNNESMKNYVIFQNGSVVNYITVQNTSMKNYADSIASNWNINYTNMQNPCTPNFVTGIYQNGTFKCGSVQQASESDPYWTANYSLLNESWLSTYNSTTNNSITNSIVANNASMNNYIGSNNQSITNAITTNNASMNNYIGSTNASINNYINSNNQSVANAINAVAGAGEPLWTANYTAFNASWSTTYNSTTNDSIKNSIAANNNSINNYIGSNNASIVNWANATFTSLTGIVSQVGNWSLDKANYYNTTQMIEINNSVVNYINFQNASQNNYITLQNGSVVNYVNLQNNSINNYINITNNSMKNYVDSTFLTGANESNMNVNNSQYLDGYDSSFFMPLNTSVYGRFDFNGGWTNNGISIIDGSLYAQAGYFYNISSLQVSNLNVNGSLLPDTLSGQFDIGSSFKKWRDLYLSGTINAANANITGTLYVAGQNISESITKNNESMNNYISSTFFSNITNFTGTLTDNKYCIYNGASGKIVCNSESGAIVEGDPKWSANYSTFLTHINWSQVMNGTLLQASQWNSTNTSYMLVSNWNATNTSYMLVSSWNSTNTSYMLVSNWNATNTSYMTEDNFTLQNTSMKNYIDWVNSTISAVGGANWNANYSQFLLNNVSTTNLINSNNASMNNYVNATNNSNNNYISSNNQSIINWATATFTSLIGIVSQVGNWSADKVNYYNTTQINDINTSMKNYVDFQNTSQTNLINSNNASVTNSIVINNQSVTNAINAVANAGEPLWTGNVTAFNASWLNTTNTSYMTWGQVTNGTLAQSNTNVTFQNITATGYIAGQPLLGMLGSGIINSTQTNQLSEVNVTCSGLTCSWNAFEVRLVSGTSDQNAKYCKISAGSKTVNNNAHNVLYIDSSCNVIDTTIESWFTKLIDDGNQWDFANMVCYNSVCNEVVNGIGLEQRRMMKQRVLNYYESHLSITGGFDKTTNTFPNWTLATGNYIYLMDVVSTTQKVASGTNTIEIIAPSGANWIMSDQNAMNYTYCVNSTGTGIQLCSNTNQWRRIFFFMIGWNETKGDTSGLHQLLPSNAIRYTSEATCLDTNVNPLTYTLPDYYNQAAVPLYAYCVKPQDNAWSSTGWIDLRTVKSGSVTSSSTGNFVPYTGATQNVDVGSFNITADWFLGKINYSSIQNVPSFISGEANWSANYSTFLTHINWSQVMNGTLLQASQWNSTNTSYMTGDNFTLQNTSMKNYVINANTTLLQILNNGSYLNSASYNDAWINQTIYNRTDVNANISAANTSVVNYITTVNTSMKNYVVDANTTLLQILNNGSYLNSASSITWATIINGTIWSWVMNGTMVKSSELNNGTYVTNLVLNNGSYWNTDTFVANYSQFLLNNQSNNNYIVSTNTTLFNILNNGSYLNSASYNDAWINQTIYNRTDVNANISAANTSVVNYITTVNTSMKNYVVDANTTLLQILNNGSYLNSASSITWATIINGTIWSWVMNGTMVKSSELNNGTYVTNLVLNNGSYWNTDTFVANYSQFLLNNQSNNNYIVSTNTTLFNILNNGSYLNSASYNDAWINQTIYNRTDVNANISAANTSVVNYITTVNTSMKNYVVDANTTLLQILNNGSYLNSASSITWATIINGTIWSWVMNGTMVKSSELNNGTYVTNLVLNNGSYWNTDTFVANYSQFLLNNQSNNNYIVSTNTTLFNILNNGSYLNSASYNDAWINQTIYNRTDVNANISAANTSVVNYITTVNTSMKNYVVDANTTLLQILNNGSYLNSASSITWATIINGTIWSWVMNGTMVKSSELNNGTYVTNLVLNNGSYWNTDTFVANYSQFLLNNQSNNNYIVSTNTTLFNILNNGSYLNSASYNDAWINQTIYNRTDVNANISAANTSVVNYITTVNTSMKNYVVDANTTLLQILNNGSYLNSASSITWATIINGTIWSWVMNGTMVKSSELNNGTYVTNLVLNNGSYWNTDTFVANYSQFLLNNQSNNNYIVSTNTTLFNILNNGSYLNSASYNDAWINQTIYNRTDVNANISAANTSVVNYITTVNTSMKNYVVDANTTLLQILNNGSYLNSASSITWATIINGTIWSWVMNGTMVKSSELNNGTYVTNLVLNNGSYWNTDTFVANYSQFLLNNQSNNNYIVSTNTTLFNILNNGSYLNSASYNDAWINQTIYNRTDVNANISAANTSVVNYITTVNTSMKNYVVDANTTLLQILNNGSYLNSASSITWATIINGTIWSWVMNGTMVKSSELNNGTYVTNLVLNNGSYWNTDTFVANYSQFLLNNQSNNNYIVSTNTTLFNILNNGSYLNSASYNDAWINQTIYNRTDVNANISAANTSVVNYITTVNTSMKNYVVDANTTLLQILNNGSYLNSASSITWATIINGTIWSWVMNGTMVKSSELNNGTYVTNLVLNNGSYWNTDTFVANYSQFLLNNQSNNNYIVSTNTTLFNILNNGSYLNSASYNDAWINQTIYNRTDVNANISAANTSVVNYITTVNTSMKNYVVDANTTLLQILNNGSYLNSASSITWATIINGTIWSWVMNGTMVKSSELNNGTYVTNLVLNNGSYWNTDTFVANYSQFLLNNQSNNNYIVSTNTTLFNILNNGSYLNSASYNDAWINQTIYNRTDVNANISAANTSVVNYITTVNTSMKNYVVDANTTLLQILNNGSYLNSASSITWATIINGTIWSWVMNGTMVKSSELNNGTYVTNLVLNNGSYWNTDTFVANYSQFLLNNQSNNNYIVSTNTTLFNILNNGSYLNSASYNDAWINQTIYNRTDVNANISAANTSVVNYITTVNTSMKNYVVDANTTLLQILNNGSYLNSASSITWATIINGTIWSWVMNGTMVKSSELNNGTYVTNLVLNNGSYWNTDTFVANYSQFLLNNQSNNNYIVSTNTTLFNILNNGSYLNSASYNDAWINQTIYNRTDVNANISAANTSMNNYITLQNGSLINWATATFTSISSIINQVGNWSLDKANYYTKTDINNFNASYLNTTNTSYLEKAGGTMTGNLNLSANVNLTMNGGNQMSSNVTCVTIKGATSTLEIC